MLKVLPTAPLFTGSAIPLQWVGMPIFQAPDAVADAGSVAEAPQPDTTAMRFSSLWSPSSNTTPTIESISQRQIPQDKPVLAVFDLHGTLMKPFWQMRYVLLHERIFGVTPTRDWFKENILGKKTPEIISNMSVVSGRPEAEIKKIYEMIREEVETKTIPEPRTGALELIKKLHARGVEIIINSGSKRGPVVDQIMATDLGPYIPETNIMGRYSDDRADFSRTRVFDSLRAMYPDHTIVYFDDWVESIGEIRDDVVCFGVPGETQYEKNRERLIASGAHYILNGGFPAEELDKMLTVPEHIQRRNVKMPIASGPAEELVTVLPAKRPNHIGLHVGVSDDMTEIEYSRVVGGSLEPLMTVPSSFLITPGRYIQSLPDTAEKRELIELLDAQKRFTTYRGITTSWDRAVDVDVWTTNIDTAFIHDRLKRLGIFQDSSIERALEIGVGGGHTSVALAALLPNLRELSITDISIYALRAAKLCIDAYKKDGTRLKYYWGKGLRSTRGGYDLIVENPPYIPTPPFFQNRDGDPYRGTGLIREVLEIGVDRLNSANPNAQIIINISSLAWRDLDRYVREFGGGLQITPVGNTMRVPLKIGSIDERWMAWLLAEQGLYKKEPTTPADEPYWHDLQVYSIKRLDKRPIIQ